AEMPTDMPAMDETPMEEMPVEMPAEAPMDIDPVAAAMMASGEETAGIDTSDAGDQVPAEMDMAAAADAMEGAVEDIEAFLDSEDYEYFTVKAGSMTTMVMKMSDGSAMSIVYEGNEFDALESSFNKDGKTVYADIMNAFVKETIKTGGSVCMTRHKGGKVVSK
ncbi:hypothetical protein, partial [Butyrivibrio sp.]|uniref:hypothetical protein n=1 Tax=Butyrivibrio sp. TaxID=28121 RepID=UPI0025B9DF7F